jgi:hypothetical protein
LGCDGCNTRHLKLYSQHPPPTSSVGSLHHVSVRYRKCGMLTPTSAMWVSEMGFSPSSSKLRMRSRRGRHVSNAPEDRSVSQLRSRCSRRGEHRQTLSSPSSCHAPMSPNIACFPSRRALRREGRLQDGLRKYVLNEAHRDAVAPGKHQVSELLLGHRRHCRVCDLLISVESRLNKIPPRTSDRPRQGQMRRSNQSIRRQNINTARFSRGEPTSSLRRFRAVRRVQRESA